MSREAKTLTTSSCQVAKQYAYVTRYFGSHRIRGVWQSKAEKDSVAALMGDHNATLDMFVKRTDHKSKTNPSKSETEQGYDMGLRGMSTHGFELVFVVEEEGIRHLVTVHFNVFYAQTSEQSLPEAMSAIRLVVNQVGRNFPWLKRGTMVSDQCTTFQAFEQILFVRLGNNGGLGYFFVL